MKKPNWDELQAIKQGDDEALKALSDGAGTFESKKTEEQFNDHRIVEERRSITEKDGTSLLVTHATHVDSDGRDAHYERYNFNYTQNLDANTFFESDFDFDYDPVEYLDVWIDRAVTHNNGQTTVRYSLRDEEDPFIYEDLLAMEQNPSVEQEFLSIEKELPFGSSLRIYSIHGYTNHKCILLKQKEQELRAQRDYDYNNPNGSWSIWDGYRDIRFKEGQASREWDQVESLLDSFLETGDIRHSVDIPPEIIEAVFTILGRAPNHPKWFDTLKMFVLDDSQLDKAQDNPNRNNLAGLKGAIAKMNEENLGDQS